MPTTRFRRRRLVDFPSFEMMDTDSSASEADDGSSSSGFSMSTSNSDQATGGEEQQQVDLDEAESEMWEDEPSIGEDIPLFEMADESAFTGDWTPFLDRLEKHPHEVHGKLGWNDRPTILHAVIGMMDSDEGLVPPSVIKAILSACPRVARVSPPPLHAACAMMGKGEACLDPECIRMLVEAYPEAAKERVKDSALDCFGKNTPLHEICKMSDIPSEELTNDIAEACAESARILLDAYPEGAMVKGNCSRLPLKCISKGNWIRRSHTNATRNEEWEDHIFRVYMAVLRGTTRALYSKHDAPVEQIDSLLLHTAIRVEERHGILAYFMEEMPELAKFRDEDGFFPLSYMNKKGSSYLDYYRTNGTIFRTLVELNPDAVGVPNNDGNLLLHAVAGSYRSSWESIKCVMDAAPRALETRDLETRLYPFMQAAVGNGQTLDTVYRLLRAKPMVASGLAEDAPWLKTKKRIKELEDERDDWKARSEAYSKENEELRARFESVSKENEELKARLAILEG